MSDDAKTHWYCIRPRVYALMGVNGQTLAEVSGEGYRDSRVYRFNSVLYGSLADAQRAAETARSKT